MSKVEEKRNKSTDCAVRLAMNGTEWSLIKCLKTSMDSAARSTKVGTEPSLIADSV